MCPSDWLISLADSGVGKRILLDILLVWLYADIVLLEVNLIVHQVFKYTYPLMQKFNLFVSILEKSSNVNKRAHARMFITTWFVVAKIRNLLIVHQSGNG